MPPIANLATPEHILHRLDWTVIRRLDGLLQGDYRTLLYGDGLDFADLREYQLQDDMRHIDWNVTARMNSLHVRQFVEEREITAWFLLDLSPSMGFGPAERSKQTVLVDLVTTLARLLTRKGNRVGAILYNNQIGRTIPPRGGRNQVLRLTRELLRESERATTKTTDTTTTDKTTTDLAVLLNAGMNSFRRRSVVFVLSDFISDPGWQRPLALLNQRHELIGIRLWDAREMELPDAGLIVVEDAETGEQMYVDTSNPDFRRRFLAAGIEREATLKIELQRVGVELFSISTEENLLGALVRMVKQRKHRRRS